MRACEALINRVSIRRAVLRFWSAEPLPYPTLFEISTSVYACATKRSFYVYAWVSLQVIAALPLGFQPIQIAFEVHLNNAYKRYRGHVEHSEWKALWAKVDALSYRYRFYKRYTARLILIHTQHASRRVHVPGVVNSLKTKDPRTSPPTLGCVCFI